MKVLITHELFMPDFAGGGEKLVYEMAKNLIAKNIDVTILTTGDKNIKEFEGIKTIRMPINRYLMNFSFFRIAKIAKDYDIIQTSTYNAALPSYIAGKIARKPVACFVFGMYGKRWLRMRGFLFGTFTRLMEKIILKRKYNRLLFISEYSRNWGKEINIDMSRTDVINPGVDINQYYPLKKEKYVLFSGRFAKQKGVYTILKVAEKLPDIKFVLMGWGEEEVEMRKLASKNVEFSSLRLKDGKDFFDMYGKAQVFFMPSIAESFGFTIVEAMASGCAVVSTIDLPYKGSVVKVDDVSGMVDSIRKLIDNPQRTNEMGKKNIERAKQFNWKNFTDKLISVYNDMLKE